MHPNAIDLVLDVKTGYVQDAGTHACQWGLLGGEAALAKLIKPGTSSCEAISGSLYGGPYGGSDDTETAENPRPIRAAPTVGAPSGACGRTTYAVIPSPPRHLGPDCDGFWPRASILPRKSGAQSDQALVHVRRQACIIHLSYKPLVRQCINFMNEHLCYDKTHARLRLLLVVATILCCRWRAQAGATGLVVAILSSTS
jgi:hypothetical protein